MSNKLAKIFDKMCLCRHFELGLIKAVEDGRVIIPVYLSLGQEAVAATLAVEIEPCPVQIFTQHRSHDIYLSFGGLPERLRDELLGLPNGTSGGRAGSNCLQHHSGNVSMFGHHGLVGENVPIGTGAALGNGIKTLIVFGDGAAEEDYVLSSIGFASTHRLPILFICVDNGLAVLTKKETRRSWNIREVAQAFGLPADDIKDNPIILHNLIAYYWRDNLPALINVRVCRERRHEGIGIDGEKEWNRLEHVRDTVGFGAEQIEEKRKVEMEELWKP